MAHPYNKKYSNFNTPGQQSPVMFIDKLFKFGKLVKNLWKGVPKKTPDPKFIIGSNLSKMQNKHNYQAMQKALLNTKINIDDALIAKKLIRGTAATGVGAGFMKVNELQEEHTENMMKKEKDKTAVDKAGFEKWLVPKKKKKFSGA
jgi:hypothetical protein